MVLALVEWPWVVVNLNPAFSAILSATRQRLGQQSANETQPGQAKECK